MINFYRESLDGKNTPRVVVAVLRIFFLSLGTNTKNTRFEKWEGEKMGN